MRKESQEGRRKGILGRDKERGSLGKSERKKGKRRRKEIRNKKKSQGK